ncbi:hypothetical protein O6P43_010669 [Quillaja saponaria]|uniref:Uncharacterized protein n=1 Tax=Quillaja saponaria TaxID=32244 RepID=A0AAD7Q1D0_QUISA|nr:hypothetical protein O6P43_010669 [Quillaja saponaria]
MEKNTNSSNSNPCACKKIRDAIASSPAFRAIRRSSSSHLPSSPAPSTPQHVKFTDNTQTATMVPIKFDYSIPTPNDKGNANVEKAVVLKGNGAIAASKVEPELSKVLMQGKAGVQGTQAAKATGNGQTVAYHDGTKTGGDINDTFADYIKRAKFKIRTMSNIGGGSTTLAPDDVDDSTKKEHTKDHFSGFIQRTKMKIRTTSSIRGGKSISFIKRE